jgi:superfamily I DNA/RNA helicase
VRFAREVTTTGLEDGDGRRATLSRVTLSTVHKAKGLEWDAVSVVAMGQGAFPFAKAPLDEERRLAYVAFTRAQNVLRVSYAAATPTGREVAPSVFLLDAKAGLEAADAAREAALHAVAR